MKTTDVTFAFHLISIYVHEFVLIITNNIPLLKLLWGLYTIILFELLYIAFITILYYDMYFMLTNIEQDQKK